LWCFCKKKFVEKFVKFILSLVFPELLVTNFTFEPIATNTVSANNTKLEVWSIDSPQNHKSSNS
jgi:hypothetical protein